jgi:hypothetical protein
MSSRRADGKDQGGEEGLLLLSGDNWEAVGWRDDLLVVLRGRFTWSGGEVVDGLFSKLAFRMFRFRNNSKLF